MKPFKKSFCVGKRTKYLTGRPGSCRSSSHTFMQEVVVNCADYIAFAIIGHRRRRERTIVNKELRSSMPTSPASEKGRAVLLEIHRGCSGYRSATALQLTAAHRKLQESSVWKPTTQPFCFRHFERLVGSLRSQTCLSTSRQNFSGCSRRQSHFFIYIC